MIDSGTTTRTAPRDVLVASAVPGVEAALHAGNELYAAEMRVAELKERREQARAERFRELYAQKLAAAAQKRYELAGVYGTALARVRAVSPATAELVEDAVWRGYLVEEA